MIKNKRLFKDNGMPDKMVAMVVGVVCGVEYWLLKYPLDPTTIYSITIRLPEVELRWWHRVEQFHEGYSTTAGITTTPGFQDDLGDMRGH